MKWSEIRSWFDESTEISLTVLVLLSTISRMLPLTCVGLSTCWIRLLSKTNSQNNLEEEDIPVRDDQLMAGRLKSPTMMTCADDEDNSVR